jgi:hypothetical protein
MSGDFFYNFNEYIQIRAVHMLFLKLKNGEGIVLQSWNSHRYGYVASF